MSISLKDYARTNLSATNLERLKSLAYRATTLRHTPRTLLNASRRSRLFRETPRVHIGCDVIRLPNFVNVDVRPTSATDLTHSCVDLKIVPDETLDVAYSQMFFEHVFYESRVNLLADIRRALKRGGELIFTGIPDFEQIAKAYLARTSPGFVSPTFDLFEVYRQTHGAPEGKPDWWLPQLHKSLFDTRVALQLLVDAGYQTGAVFNHLNATDPYPLCIGLYARKTTERETVEKADIERVIGICKPSIVIAESVAITGRIDGAAAARTASMG